MCAALNAWPVSFLLDLICVLRVLNVSDEEWAKRKAAWKAPPLKATQGTLYKYIKAVSSASEGCVTDA
jgi:dihydroxyacid dehydratase/phosphogluconate dehydratase